MENLSMVAKSKSIPVHFAIVPDLCSHRGPASDSACLRPGPGKDEGCCGARVNPVGSRFSHSGVFAEPKSEVRATATATADMLPA